MPPDRRTVRTRERRGVAHHDGAVSVPVARFGGGDEAGRAGAVDGPAAGVHVRVRGVDPAAQHFDAAPGLVLLEAPLDRRLIPAVIVRVVVPKDAVECLPHHRAVAAAVLCSAGEKRPQGHARLAHQVQHAQGEVVGVVLGYEAGSRQVEEIVLRAHAVGRERLRLRRLEVVAFAQEIREMDAVVHRNHVGTGRVVVGARQGERERIDLKIEREILEPLPRRSHGRGAAVDAGLRVLRHLVGHPVLLVPAFREVEGHERFRVRDRLHPVVHPVIDVAARYALVDGVPGIIEAQ